MKTPQKNEKEEGDQTEMARLDERKSNKKWIHLVRQASDGNSLEGIQWLK